MERAVFVYTTHPSTVEAERIGRVLVERRLCACVSAGGCTVVSPRTSTLPGGLPGPE